MVTNAALNKKECHRSRRRSQYDHLEWENRVGHALKNLGDRSILNQSQLTRLDYIERLAVEKYAGHTLPRGLALHDTLLTCVKKVASELGNEPGLARACQYLHLLLEGLSCSEISRRFGLSREHVSRIYRRKAIELVTEEFLSTVRNGKQTSWVPRASDYTKLMSRSR
jgi:AraC-like DNA-binding protein